MNSSFAGKQRDSLGHVTDWSSSRTSILNRTIAIEHPKSFGVRGIGFR